METKTNNGQFRQFVSSVVANMPDVPANIMQGWIENPKELQKVLSEALLPPQKFEVWKIVKIGGFRNADEVRKVLGNAGMNISSYADDILGKIPLATEETEIALALVSLSDLGLGSRASRGDIYERAGELGLRKCPKEVGPQLRRQYDDQPEGEWVIVASEPIADSDGDFELFFVARDGNGLWLDSDYGNSDRFWRIYDRFVFVLPQVK